MRVFSILHLFFLLLAVTLSLQPVAADPLPDPVPPIELNLDIPDGVDVNEQDQPDIADDSSAEFQSYITSMLTFAVVNLLVYSSAAVMHRLGRQDPYSFPNLTRRNLVPSWPPPAPPFPSLPPPVLPHEIEPEKTPRAEVLRWDSINSLYVSSAACVDEEHVYDEWKGGAEEATDAS
nr:uncharacterized protein LOC113824462 [Penaeus vannamei]XP_027233005.1 uncharacterized protein LOC113824462 [Penaeus vannamei]